MAIEWGPVVKNRQVLTLRVDGQDVGWLHIGVRNAEDEDDPYVALDYARVAGTSRGSAASLDLIRAVHTRWPDARIVGGPLRDDDPPGPRFRLRCWDEAGVGVHTLGCWEPQDCACRGEVVEEVKRRLRQWHAEGGITRDDLTTKLARLSA